MQRNAQRRSCAVLALIALAPSAYAQTIVPNPYLNTQLPPWTAFLSAAPDPAGSGNAPVWQATPDFDGSPASGSALIQLGTGAPPLNTAPPVEAVNAVNGASGIAQCVNFASVTQVDYLNYSLAFRRPAATVADSSVSATVEIRLFSAAGCSGFISGGTQQQTLTSANVPADTWQRVGDNGFVPTGAPVMAASAEIRGYLRQTGGAPSQAGYAINVDQFVLVLNSSTPVQLMHFEID